MQYINHYTKIDVPAEAVPFVEIHKSAAGFKADLKSFLPIVGHVGDGSGIEAIRAIKHALDPLNIFNPGKIF